MKDTQKQTDMKEVVETTEKKTNTCDSLNILDNEDDEDGNAYSY